MSSKYVSLLVTALSSSDGPDEDMDTSNSTSEGSQSAVPKKSSLAVASLIAGVCAIVMALPAAVLGLALSAAGFVLGAVALLAIKKTPVLTGRGLATGGMVVSIVALTANVTMLIVLAGAVDRVSERNKTTLAIYHARQLCAAVLKYREDHGSLPPSGTWPDAIAQYLADGSVLTSPFDPDAGRAWAMNANLDRTDLAEPANAILFFEAKFGSPPAGGSELLPAIPRPGEEYVVGFLDGRAAILPPDTVKAALEE